MSFLGLHVGHGNQLSGCGQGITDSFQEIKTVKISSKGLVESGKEIDIVNNRTLTL